LKYVAFRGGKELVTWGWDETLRIWDISSGAELSRKKRDPPRETIFADALSPDGSALAVYGGTLKTHFLDPATGKTRPNSVEVIPGMMVFSPDGQYLAGSNLDRQTIGVWEVASGRSR